MMKVCLRGLTALILIFSIPIKSNASKTTATQSVCSSLGPQRIAVIVGSYVGAPASFPVANINYLKELFLGTPGGAPSGTPKEDASISDYLKTVSGGRTWVENVDFFGPYIENKPLVHDFSGPLSIYSTMQYFEQRLAQTAALKDMDVSKYDRIIFFTPPPLNKAGLQPTLIGAGMASNQCDFSFQNSQNTGKRFAEAWIGSTTLYAGILPSQLATTFSQYPLPQQHQMILSRKLQDMGIITHEIGHTFGLNHANRIARPQRNSSSLTHDEVLPDSNVTPLNQLQYSDPFSIMGSNQGWLSVPHLAYLNWINKNELKEVLTSGTFRIYPLYQGSGDLKSKTKQSTPHLLGLKIPRPSLAQIKTDATLWVEYRQPTSVYDTNSKSRFFWSGALVHYSNSSQPSPYNFTKTAETILLNFQLHGVEDVFEKNFTLTGDWKDPYSPIELKVLKITPDYLDIKVSFNP